MPSGPIDEPLIPRGTWAAPQKPGWWVVEKLGNERVVTVELFIKSIYVLRFDTFMRTMVLLTPDIRFAGQGYVVRLAPRSSRLRSADTGIHHVPLQLRTRRQGTLGGAPAQWSIVDEPLTHSCAIWWAPPGRACAGEEEQRGDARPVESAEAGVELLSL